MRRRFMLSMGGVPNVFVNDYYVSVTGDGTGFIPSDPMSPAAFALIVLQDGNRVFFLEGDEF